MKKDLVYPFFLTCIVLCNDTYWKIVFEDLAYGIAPFGVHISRDYLFCNYKGKEFSYKIEEKSPEVLHKEVFSLLSKFGVQSNLEKQKKIQEFKTLEKELREKRTNWIDIKKKSIKDFLIEMYVLKIKKEQNLSIQQVHAMLSKIFIGMVFKTISFEFENGEIVKINGIDYTGESFPEEAPLTREIVIPSCNMIENWEKFILTKLKLDNIKTC